MFKRRDKRDVPGLNTTATSDISFMLLIFFLVTTSMDTDKGLGRQLPPIDPEEQEQVMDVDQSRIMTIHLMKDGKIAIDDKEAKIDASLRRDIRHFIIEKGRTHIIELQVDRSSDYDSYFHIQNQIILAYKEIRDAAAKKKYGHDLQHCTEEQKEDIQKYYPQRIQEISVE